MPDKQNQDAQNTASAAKPNDKSDKPNASDAISQQNAKAESPVETVKNTAKAVYEQAKDTAGEAYGAATEKAASKIEEQKNNLSGGLSGVADSIRKVGESLRDSDEKNPVTDLTAKYGDKLASRIEDASTYFERKDWREILSDTEKFARRNPAAFVGGALALGFLAARFLKSSNTNQALMRRPQNSKNDKQTSNSNAADTAQTSKRDSDRH